MLRRWVAPYARHANQAAIMQRAFEQQLMIAHEIAMVAGENHHGIVVIARPVDGLGQLFQYFARKRIALGVKKLESLMDCTCPSSARAG